MPPLINFDIIKMLLIESVREKKDLQAHKEYIEARQAGKPIDEARKQFDEALLEIDKLKSNNEPKIKIYESREVIEIINNRPKIEYLVNELFPQKGIVLIAGASGTGKSFFALQLCYALAAGTSFLGKETKKADSLYMVLDDTTEMFTERIEFFLNGQEKNNDQNKVSFIFPASLDNDQPLLNIDFNYLEELLQQHQNIKVVIVDNFAIFTSIKDINDNSLIYPIMKRFRQIIEKYNILICLTCHTNKSGSAGSPLSKVLGAQSIVGGSDIRIVIDRLQHEEEGTIYILSKNRLTVEYSAEFKDKIWSITGSKKEKKNNEIDQEILDYLTDKEAQSPSEISTAFKQLDIKIAYPTVKKHLKTLLEKGFLKNDNGKYSLEKKEISEYTGIRSLPPDTRILKKTQNTGTNTDLFEQSPDQQGIKNYDVVKLVYNHIADNQHRNINTQTLVIELPSITDEEAYEAVSLLEKQNMVYKDDNGNLKVNVF